VLRQQQPSRFRVEHQGWAVARSSLARVVLSGPPEPLLTAAMGPQSTTSRRIRHPACNSQTDDSTLYHL